MTEKPEIHKQLAEIARFPDMNPGPVLRVDTDGNIIMSNMAAQSIFGSKLKSCCWQDICPGIDAQFWDRIVNTSQSVALESVIDNTFYIFSHRFDPDTDQIFVFGTNITELKQAQKALHESEQQVRLLLNSTVEGIYGIDLQGNCTFANSACAELLGFDNVDELHGQQMHSLVHRHDFRGTVCSYEQSRIYQALKNETGTYVNDEVMFRRDNSNFPVEYWSHPVKQEGKIIGCVVTFMDATDRREMERLQSDYTSALAEIARFPEMNPGPVLRLDHTGKVLMANKAAHSIFHNPANNYWQHICPEMDEKTWKHIIKRNTVALERRIGDREFIFTHRREMDSQLVFVFGSDITDQKQAERALLQAEKIASLGKLSAGLAHELNNPASAAVRAADQLTGMIDALQTSNIAISGVGLEPALWRLLYEWINEFRRRFMDTSQLSALEICDREVEIQDWLESHNIPDSSTISATLVRCHAQKKDLEEIHAHLPPGSLHPAILWLYNVLSAYELSHHIVGSTHRISNLVKIVKSYTLMDSAEENFVDIHIGIEDTIAMLAHRIHDGIEIIRDYDRTLPKIKAFGGELNQVWTSIIDNAIYALDGRGKISIKTFRRKNWLVITIEDTGPGISADNQSRIFDPFFTTKAPGEGTGMGLNISHRIIEQKHNGKLTLKSKPGFTCFEIRMPLSSAK